MTETKTEKTAKANRLKILRDRSRLTQREVAKLMDIDYTTVSKHEAGTRGLTREEVENYARVFKCESYEIFMEPSEATISE